MSALAAGLVLFASVCLGHLSLLLTGVPEGSVWAALILLTSDMDLCVWTLFILFCPVPGHLLGPGRLKVISWDPWQLLLPLWCFLEGLRSLRLQPDTTTPTHHPRPTPHPTPALTHSGSPLQSSHKPCTSAPVAWPRGKHSASILRKERLSSFIASNR